MPWRQICPMDEKLRFVAAVLAVEQSIAASVSPRCFGIAASASDSLPSVLGEGWGGGRARKRRISVFCGASSS